MKKSSLLRATSFFILLGGLLAGCAGGPAERVWLQAPGWSRGVVVAQTQLSDPAPMTLSSNGILYLLTQDQGGGPALVSVDTSDGSVAAPRPISGMPAGRGTAFDLKSAGDRMWVLWIQAGSLMAAEVDPGAAAVGSVAELSPGHSVASYDAALSPGGELIAFFSGGVDEPGIFQATLADPRPAQVSSVGVRPTIIFDQAGTLHAAWMDVPESQGLAPIYYAAYPDGMVGPGAGQVVAEQSLSPTDGLQGPLLGLSGGQATVFYVLTIRTGLEAGKIKPNFVSFPLDNPSAATVPATLEIPASADLAYNLGSDGGLQVGSRAAITAAGAPGEHVSQLAIPDRPVPEMAAALRARVEFRMNQEQTQIGAVYLDASGPASYQQLTFTTSGSSQPSMVVSSDSYVFVSWLEPAEGGGSNLYLAGTQPSLVDAFSGITGRDITQMISESVFGMLSGIVLVPLALVWMIAPLLVVVVSSFWRSGDDRISKASTWIPLALAVLAYWVAKRAFIPEIFSYVPFSAWVPIIGPVVGAILRFGLPLLGSALALWVAYAYTYGRDRTSPTFFILIFSAVDAIVSMALYGGLFLGF